MRQAVEAQEYCSSMGGKLIEPENAEEDTAVLNYLIDNFGIAYYYIGINDVMDEGRYVLAFWKL
jgi:hypothetical protein